MRLAMPASLLKIAGIQSSPGTLALAGMALDDATLRCEELLETRLASGAYLDYFYIDDTPRMFPSKQLPVLRLTHRFIDTDTFALYESADGTSADPATSPLIAATDYTINAEEGVIRLKRSVALGFDSIVAAYTCGFVQEEPYGAEEAPLPTGLPDWLSQLALKCALYTIKSDPANIAKDKAALLPTVLRTMERATRSVAESKARPRDGVIWPIRNVPVVAE